MSSNAPEPINSLLEQARAAAAQGELEHADLLYKQALNLAAGNNALFDQIDEELEQFTQKRPKTAPPAPAATTTPPSPGTPASAIESTTLQYIHSLEAKADSYLIHASNENYKQALKLISQILDFGVVTGSERLRYEQRLRQIEQDRERFLVPFGALITARQLSHDADQMISLRRLIASGQTKGPEGELLDDHLADLRGAFIRKLLDQVRGEASQAAIAREEGLEFLDQIKLRAAADRYSRALLRLEQLEITPESPIPVDQEAQTREAISNLIQQVRQHPEVVAQVEQLRRDQSDAERLRNRSGDLARRYKEADQDLIDGKFEHATNRFLQIQRLLAPETSRQINLMLELAREGWEKLARPRAERMLIQAQEAFDLGHLEEAGALIERFAELEAGLKSEAFDALRSRAKILNAQIDQRRGSLTERLRQLRSTIQNAPEELDHAISQVSLILSDHPAFNEAAALRDKLLSARAELAEQEARIATQSNDPERMIYARDDLDVQIAALWQHSDPQEAGTLRNRLARRRDMLSSQLGDIHGRQAKLAELERYLDACEKQLRIGMDNHQEELLRLSQRRQSHLLNIKLQQRIDSLEQRIGASYENYLWDEVREYLPDNPAYANPEAALKRIAQLKELSGPDLEDIKWYEQRAQRLVARQKGFNAFQDNDMATAFAMLRLAREDHDQDVIDTLRIAAQRHAESLVNRGSHSEAIEALEVCDPGDSKTQELLRRAQAGHTIEAVRRLTAAYSINEAEAQIARMATADPGILAELRQAVAAARQRQDSIASLRARAEALLGTSDQLNLDALQAVITEIDQQIHTLPEQDLHAAEMARLHQQLVSHRGSRIDQQVELLIREAHDYQRQRSLGLSLERFNKAATLATGTTRAEAEQRSREIEEEIKTERRKIAEEAQSLLQSRSLDLAMTRKLLEDLQAVISWSPDNSDLNDLPPKIQAVADLLANAEQLLDKAVRQWAAARSHGESLDSVSESIRQAAAGLNGQNFGHKLLTDDREHSLLRRIDDSQAVLNQANAEQRALHQLIEQEKPDIDLIMRGYRQLASYEQTMLQELQSLSQQGLSIPEPRSWAERCPLQIEILGRLLKRHNQIIDQATNVYEVNELIALLRRGQILQNLIEQLDYEDESGVRQQIRRIE